LGAIVQWIVQSETRPLALSNPTDPFMLEESFYMFSPQRRCDASLTDHDGCFFGFDQNLTLLALAKVVRFADHLNLVVLVC
jgi:hypothetical protein